MSGERSTQSNVRYLMSEFRNKKQEVESIKSELRNEYVERKLP